MLQYAATAAADADSVCHRARKKIRPLVVVGVGAVLLGGATRDFLDDGTISITIAMPSRVVGSEPAVPAAQGDAGVFAGIGSS